MVQAAAVITRFESQRSRQLIVHAKRKFMLLVWLQARSNAFFSLGASRARRREGTEVLVLEERQACGRRATKVRLARRIRAHAVAMVRPKHRRDRSNVRSIQGVVALLPELSAERTDR